MAESSTRRIRIAVAGIGSADSKIIPSSHEPTMELLTVRLESEFEGVSSLLPVLSSISLYFKIRLGFDEKASLGSIEVVSEISMFIAATSARSDNSWVVDTGAGATFKLFDSWVTPTMRCDLAGNLSSRSKLETLVSLPPSSWLKIGKSK
jgi:hypothetical protein